MTKLEKFIDELDIMLSASMTPLVVTKEEERFILSLRPLLEKFDSEKEGIRVFIWSSTEGLSNFTPFLRKSGSSYNNPTIVEHTEIVRDRYLRVTGTEGQSRPVQTFEQVMAWIDSDRCDNSILIIKDVHHFLDFNLRTQHYDKSRKIKDLIYHFRKTKSWLILLSNNYEMGDDLSSEVSLLDMPLPDEKEISDLLDVAARGFSTFEDIKIDIKFDDGGKSRSSKATELKDKIIFNLRGLTESEISQVLTYSCVKNRGLTKASLDDIRALKRKMIEKKGYLSFIPVTDEIEIGGHENLKDYIETKGYYLNKKYNQFFNLKPPKGICVTGIPGSGKSVFAKYIGNKFNIPLIRLELDAIFGQFLGQSESRLRDALKIVEANSPCILWLEEIEKSMGNLSSGDSGTSSRILGKLLTWMAEREEMVFLYLTANSLVNLPPEFKRAGRLDAIFYADLPLQDECEKIIRIHCHLNKINLSDTDYSALAKVAYTLGMTGAEIEGGIIESNFAASKESFVTKQEISSNKRIIEECFKKINCYSKNNPEILIANRREALDKFEFTSEEAKVIVKKLLDVKK